MGSQEEPGGPWKVSSAVGEEKLIWPLWPGEELWPG